MFEDAERIVNPGAFTSDISRCRTRVDQLQSRLSAADPRVTVEPVLHDALQELGTSLEELQVADEELRQQNEALREAHAELAREKHRYAVLFNSAPDACLITDARAVILEANTAAAALLGIAPTRIAGKPLALYVATEYKAAFRLQIAEAAGRRRVGGMRFALTPRAARPAHAPDPADPPAPAPRVPVEASVQVLTGPDGQAHQLMWIIRDITERVRAEEALTAANLALEESNRDLETHVAARTSALQQTKSQLEVQLRQKEMLLEELRRGEARLIERTRELARSNEDLQEFAYAASHDLKEPLRGIGNFARMLREDEHGLAPQSLERLHTIERLAERLHTLLDSLLEYSRAGRLALALEPTDLTGVAREAADALAPWLAERGGTVSIGALPAALCDRQRIAGVLASLIVNGVQYNLSESKRVAISGQRSGDLVRVTVADNGIGIGPRHFDAVFKMFRRLHPQNRFGGGSGAGLATARKIIERHGGQITVQSAPGEGSAFTFTLPAAGSGPA